MLTRLPSVEHSTIVGGGGVELAVRRTGSSSTMYPPLLFIHGIGVSQDWWGHQFASDLSNEGQVVSFDLRGHGASDKPTEPCAYQDSQLWADDLHAVMQALHLDRPILCSWSYGALVVCDYLRYYGQENLAGLIFVDGNFTVGTAEAKAWIRPTAWCVLLKLFSEQTEMYREGLFASLCPLLLSSPPASEDALAFLGAASSVSPATWQAMFSRHLEHWDLLSSLQVPVLLIHGQQDQIFDPISSQTVSRLIPQARLQMFPTGHAPFYEQTAAFNQTLEAFRVSCAVRRAQSIPMS